MVNNTEHTIQSLFHDIMGASIRLKAEKKQSITLLTQAGRNEWLDNLSGKLQDSFEEVNQMAELATKKSITLRKTLEDSQYRDIFNFGKYDQWIKTQILAPIQEILDILRKNKITILETMDEMESTATKKMGDNFWGDTGQKALGAQKVRFEVQVQSIDRMIGLLE